MERDGCRHPDAEERFTLFCKPHNELPAQGTGVERRNGYACPDRGQVIGIHRGVDRREHLPGQDPSDKSLRGRPCFGRIDAHPPEEVPVCPEQGFILDPLQRIPFSYRADDPVFQGIQGRTRLLNRQRPDIAFCNRETGECGKNLLMHLHGSYRSC
jgi:hypothetical protein